MPSKFSMFAQKTKDLESKAQGSSSLAKQNLDPIPEKDKSPDDQELL